MNLFKRVGSAFVAALAVLSLTACNDGRIRCVQDKEKVTVERTLTIIKPDAAGDKEKVEQIEKIIKAEGFKIINRKEMKLTREQALQFYYIHKEKPFFDKLCEFMTSGKIVVLVIEKENAIEDYRKLMGPTNSQEADKTTIRGKFGTDKTKNAVHGSDSQENAVKEIEFFFNQQK